ncbi:MAG: D-alanine--D-alanine ligase family protein [Eubacterium sp.]|nr:D-alanine--D-alanine ligase family protein [Eubacterium sp.]
MEQKINIGVVFGGQSGEHEISRISAVNVIDVIDRDKYDLTLIGITKDGRWMLYKGDYTKIRDGAWETDTENIVSDIDVFNDAAIKAVDLFFPILHGPMGEDGTIQGVFEMINKPYVGCGVMASAVAMDKVMTKVVCEKAGVPTGPYVSFKARQWQQDAQAIVDDIVGRGFPVFIKPVNMGSSVGITKAHNADELVAGVEEALKYDDKIIIEGFINGREIECAVLEDNGVVKAAVPGEIKASKEFYDYEAKYAEGQQSEAVIPAPISDKLIEQIKDYAIKAFEAIDGSGLARVDFFVTHATYNIYLNEINTMPGFTNISLYPKMWEASGIPYAELVEKLIQSAARKRKFVEYR